MSIPLPDYPLEEVRNIKLDRVEAARRLVKQRREELEREKEKLKEAEAARNKVLQHRQDKLDQIRAAFDEGTNSDEILMMKRYLKVVQEKLEAEEQKVKAQEEEVEKAKQALLLAEEDVKLRQLEVDKLDTHKAQWIQQTKQELLREEEKELDEIGNVLFLKNRDKWK